MDMKWLNFVFNSILYIRRILLGEGGFDTNWDGHHDGGVVGRDGQFPLSANALSGQKLH